MRPALKTPARHRPLTQGAVAGFSKLQRSRLLVLKGEAGADATGCPRSVVQIVEAFATW